MNFLIAFAVIISTILIFFVARKVNSKWSYPFTIPILTSSLCLICGLLLFGISYETYKIGGKWLEELLGPAVVALAFPLYKHRKMLITYAIPLTTSVFIGSTIGIISGIALTRWAGFSDDITYSMVPKSVTTPVAVEIMDTIGGIPTLAAVLVVVAGIFGAVVHDSLFKWLKLEHFLARGVGMGTASHAIGTARSMEINEREGVISTVSMTISAVIVSIIAPIIIFLMS